MDIEIVKMEQRHIESVYNLEKEAFSSPWSLKDIEYQLYNGNSFFSVALLRDSGEVTGYIGVTEISGEAYISNVAVFEKFKRRGIGRLLVSQSAENAFNRKCEFISLEVRESNLPAIKLYESLKFTRMGIRKNFYSNPPENAVIYTLFNGNRKE